MNDLLHVAEDHKNSNANLFEVSLQESGIDRYVPNEKFRSLKGSGNSDANLFEVGFQECKPGHYVPNYIPPHNVLHFIISGKGVFKVRNKEYIVEPGSGMFSPQNVPVTYHADKEDPWVYAWIHFSGARMEEYLNRISINSKFPIYQVRDAQECKNLIIWMYDYLAVHHDPLMVDIHSLRLCYDLLAHIVEDNPNRHMTYTSSERQQLKYVEQAIVYMQTHLGEDIKVPEIASNIGLNSNYLSGLFKTETGMSLQQYLIRMKLQSSIYLLMDTDLPISLIAQQVGYGSTAAFCKAFRNMYGKAPTEGRCYGID